jgi:hypothetical protein
MRNRRVSLLNIGPDTSFDASMTFVQSTLQITRRGSPQRCCTCPGSSSLLSGVVCAPLCRHRGGDDRGGWRTGPAWAAKNLAAGRAVDRPQGGGPGAQQRVDEISAVLVRRVGRRRWLIQQLAGQRVAAQQQRRNRAAKSIHPPDQFAACRGPRQPPAPSAASGACACSGVVHRRRRSPARGRRPASCRGSTRTCCVRPRAAPPTRRCSASQPSAVVPAALPQPSGVSRGWWCSH